MHLVAGAVYIPDRPPFPIFLFFVSGRYRSYSFLSLLGMRGFSVFVVLRHFSGSRLPPPFFFF